MDYVLIFLAGLFGSMHCAGMCGAIVAAYSTQDNFRTENSPGKWRAMRAHFSYNFGRVLSYTIIGGLLGALGGSFSGLEIAGEWFSTIVGFFLIASGIWMLRLFPWMGFKEKIKFEETGPSLLLSLYTKTYGALLQSPTLESKFYIGLLTPLLPCGLLYSMFVMAAGSGNAFRGAITMALFGSGIIPALVIVGFVSSFFRLRLRLWGDKLAAATIVLMGLMMVLRGLGVPLPWMMGSHHHQM